jgi:hypothetical protein
MFSYRASRPIFVRLMEGATEIKCSKIRHLLHVEIVDFNYAHACAVVHS